MDRPVIYSEEQGRTFDVLSGWREALIAICQLEADLSGSLIGQLAGLAGTPTSPATLTINLAAGSVYQQSVVDGTTYGALPSDTQVIQQQGIAAAQQVTLTTSALSAGQSQWVLIEAQFAQVDEIAPGDPTAGLLLYYNSLNPAQPLQGPGGNGQVQPTVRLGTISIRAVFGTPATTGSEVPPNVDNGWLPMYLIDLTFGQSQITSGQILKAGPSVGANVPSNYPGAPFLAGLLNQHHLGIPGQAPQIDLTAEVKNALPLVNLPASNTSGGGVPVMKLHAGNPNGSVAGNASVNGASDLCYDTTNKILYICTTTGTTSTAVWTAVVGSTSSQFAGGTTTGTANAQTLPTTIPAGFSLTSGFVVTATIGSGLTNTGSATLNVSSTGAITINKNTGSGNVPLTGGELTAGQFVSFIYTGTVWLLQAQALGQLATLNIGNFLRNDGSGNLTVNNGLTLGSDGAGELTVQAATITPQMMSTAGAQMAPIATQPNDNLHLSNDATNPTFVVDFTVGRVRDDTDATNLQLGTAMTKRLDQSWAGGTGNGACDTSTKGPNQTWHWYLIGKIGMTPTQIARTSNVATVTIANHGLGVGSPFRTQGFGNGFDGLQVATAVTTNTITWSSAGSNVSATSPPATALVDGFDILASQSYPTPTYPSGWNAKQSLGSVLTDSSGNIISFFQYGDEFWLKNPILSSTATANSNALQTLSVPQGVKVKASLNVMVGTSNSVNSQMQVYVAPPDVTNASGSQNSAPGLVVAAETQVNATTQIGAGQVNCWTNASGQVWASVQGAGQAYFVTTGWRDARRRMF